MDLSTPESRTGDQPRLIEVSESPSSFRHAIDRLRRDWIVASALVALLGLFLLAILAPVLAPHNPLKLDVYNGFTPPAFMRGGNPEFLLGTDSLGRDELSRLIFGARISLLVAFSTVALGGSVGLILGLVSGYYGGRIDNVIMRLVDGQMAFPFMLLAIAIISVLGPNLRNLIFVLAFSSWVFFARLVRGEVLSIKQREFIEAARMVGIGDMGIMLRYVLPNVINPVIVIATFSVAQTVLYEAGLSYLGLGVQAPTPSWGSMLSEARLYMMSDPWLSVFPGLVIMLTVMSVNVLGDWLRDLLDPRLRV